MQVGGLLGDQDRVSLGQDQDGGAQRARAAQVDQGGERDERLDRLATRRPAGGLPGADHRIVDPDPLVAQASAAVRPPRRRRRRSWRRSRPRSSAGTPRTASPVSSPRRRRPRRLAHRVARRLKSPWPTPGGRWSRPTRTPRGSRGLDDYQAALGRPAPPPGPHLARVHLPGPPASGRHPARRARCPRRRAPPPRRPRPAGPPRRAGALSVMPVTAPGAAPSRPGAEGQRPGRAAPGGPGAGPRPAATWRSASAPPPGSAGARSRRPRSRPAG